MPRTAQQVLIAGNDAYVVTLDVRQRPADGGAEPGPEGHPEDQPARDQPARRLRWLPSRLTGIRFSRYTVGSLVSTVASQLTLTGLYGLGGMNATTASILAFAAGAIPSFVINWHWTWGRQGRPTLLRELAPYLVIIIGGGLAATALTEATEWLVAPLITSRGWRTIVLDLAYLSSYGALFVVKFALLNRVLGSRRRDAAQVTRAGEASTNSRSQDQVMTRA